MLFIRIDADIIIEEITQKLFTSKIKNLLRKIEKSV